MSLFELDVSGITDDRRKTLTLVWKITQTFWIKRRTEYLFSLRGKAK